jgi:hypothetical protein
VTPTIGGRIQTRIFLIAVIGSLWTLIVGPVLPGTDGLGLGQVYSAAFQVLAIVLVLGLVWEVIYHAFQQFRWEKDWPIMFGFFEGIPEGILAWFVVVQLDFVSPSVPTSTFIAHFASTWIVTWLFANGPIRVFFVRHRFIGGRFV